MGIEETGLGVGGEGWGSVRLVGGRWGSRVGIESFRLATSMGAHIWPLQPGVGGKKSGNTFK